MTPQAYEAAKRLISLAKGDTDQSQYARNFILAWWNAHNFGGFDLIDMFSVDIQYRDDMATVFLYLSSLTGPKYPQEFESEIVNLIEVWEPRRISWL